MLSREDLKETIPDLDDRAAYLVFHQINGLLPLCKETLGHHPFFFKDGLEEARQALDKLRVAHQQFSAAMFLEEQSRKQFGLPNALYKAHRQAELALKQASRDYEFIVKNMETEKIALRDKESQLSRDIQAKRLELSNEQGDEIVEFDKKFRELDSHKKDLARRKGELNREIETKCCGCFPSRTAGERAELLRVETDLENTMKELKTINEARGKRQQQELEIRKLLEEQVATRMAIAQHAESVVKRCREAEEKQMAKQIILEEKAIAIKKQRARYNASIQAALMLKAIRVSHAFMIFKTKIDIQHGSYQRQNKKSEKLQSLRGRLSEVKDRLDELLAQLWLPEAGNQFATDFYKRFTELSDKEKADFLSNDQSPVISQVLQVTSGVATSSAGMRFLTSDLSDSDDEGQVLEKDESQSEKITLSEAVSPRVMSNGLK